MTDVSHGLLGNDEWKHKLSASREPLTFTLMTFTLIRDIGSMHTVFNESAKTPRSSVS